MASLLDTGAAPGAVFVTNNLMALGAAECLLDRGFAVPDDVGLIGFDDLPWSNLLRPALSSVAQPTYELGRTAADLLAARILNPQRPTSTVILPTWLRIRDSSGRPARG
jgi:LacI family transcriptional regulator